MHPLEHTPLSPRCTLPGALSLLFAPHAYVFSRPHRPQLHQEVPRRLTAIYIVNTKLNHSALLLPESPPVKKNRAISWETRPLGTLAAPDRRSGIFWSQRRADSAWWRVEHGKDSHFHRRNALLQVLKGSRCLLRILVFSLEASSSPEQNLDRARNSYLSKQWLTVSSKQKI